MQEEEDYIAAGRLVSNGHFHPGLRQELIKLIEAGTPRSVIAYHYGVSRAAISKWMRDHGSAEYRSKQMETNLRHARRRSLKANAELALYDPFEMKDKPEDEPGLKDPEKEALKKALEEAGLKISALNTLIDVAEDQFKIKIRKKAGARQSGK
jgi:hypothetical protein